MKNDAHDTWTTLGGQAERVLAKIEQTKTRFRHAVPIDQHGDEERSNTENDSDAAKERKAYGHRHTLAKLG